MTSPNPPRGASFKAPLLGGVRGGLKIGTDYNRVLLQQDELGEAKSAPAEGLRTGYEI
jgi:hypothetical protein